MIVQFTVCIYFKLKRDRILMRKTILHHNNTQKHDFLELASFEFKKTKIKACLFGTCKHIKIVYKKILGIEI